jgi:hypothetical protein
MILIAKLKRIAYVITCRSAKFPVSAYGCTKTTVDSGLPSRKWDFKLHATKISVYRRLESLGNHRKPDLSAKHIPHQHPPKHIPQPPPGPRSCPLSETNTQPKLFHAREPLDAIPVNTAVVLKVADREGNLRWMPFLESFETPLL